MVGVARETAVVIEGAVPGVEVALETVGLTQQLESVAAVAAEAGWEVEASGLAVGVAEPPGWAPQGASTGCSCLYYW